MSEPEQNNTPDPANKPEPSDKPKGGIFKVIAGMWLDGGPERTRLVVWIVLGGAGVYLIVTGIVGVITKAR